MQESLIKNMFFGNLYFQSSFILPTAGFTDNASVLVFDAILWCINISEKAIKWTLL